MDMKQVKSPKHYTEGRKIEPWDAIADWGLNFNRGNVVRYIARAGRKDDELQDLYKAKEYLDKEISLVEAKRKAQDPKPATPKHPNCKCAGARSEAEKIVEEAIMPDFEEFLRNIGVIPTEAKGVEIYAIEVPNGTAPEEVIQRFIERVYKGE